MRKLIELLPWTEFLDVHLVKDTGVFAKFFSKKYDIPTEIVFCDNKDTGTRHKEFSGVKLVKLVNLHGYKHPPRLRNVYAFFRFVSIFTDYLLSQKRTFSHVMMFHISPYTLFLAKFIRKRFSDVKIYVKADSGVVSGFTSFIFKKLIKTVDLISLENESLVSVLQEKYKMYSKKISYIPNGFDSAELSDNDLQIKKIEEKQNLLITTARLGTYQKNTEFLLMLLEKLNLRDWKVKLIGTYTDEIVSLYEEICAKNKDFAAAVEFTGNISDRKELFSYFNNAKLFVLPSRWESFGLAAMEAMAFGCFPIISPIDSANGLTANGTIGKILPLNIGLWASEIQKLIDDDKPIKDSYQTILNYCSENFTMSKLVEKECFKKFFSSQGEAI